MAWQNTYYHPWPTSMYLHDDESQKETTPRSSNESPRRDVDKSSNGQKHLAGNHKVTQPPASGLISQPQMRHVDRSRAPPVRKPAQPNPDRSSLDRRKLQQGNRGSYPPNGLNSRELQNGRNGQLSNGHTPANSPRNGVQNGAPLQPKDTTNGAMPQKAQDLTIPRAKVVKKGYKNEPTQPQKMESGYRYGTGIKPGFTGQKDTVPLDAESLHVHFPTASQIAIAKSHSSVSDRRSFNDEKRGINKKCCIGLVVVLVLVGIASIAIAVYFALEAKTPAAQAIVQTTASTSTSTRTSTATPTTIDYFIRLTLDQEFDADLNTNTSDKYKNYTKDFCEMMEDLPDVYGCDVLNFRNGSVIIEASLQFTETYISSTETDTGKTFAVALSDMLEDHLNDTSKSTVRDFVKTYQPKYGSFVASKANLQITSPPPQVTTVAEATTPSTTTTSTTTTEPPPTTSTTTESTPTPLSTTAATTTTTTTAPEIKTTDAQTTEAPIATTQEQELPLTTQPILNQETTATSTTQTSTTVEPATTAAATTTTTTIAPTTVPEIPETTTVSSTSPPDVETTAETTTEAVTTTTESITTEVQVTTSSDQTTKVVEETTIAEEETTTEALLELTSTAEQKISTPQTLQDTTTKTEVEVTSPTEMESSPSTLQTLITTVT